MFWKRGKWYSIVFSAIYFTNFPSSQFQKEVYHFEQSALQTGLNCGATNFL
jgi:hypothetical protein